MSDNITRFVVLSRDPLLASELEAGGGRFKTSIVFSLQEVGWARFGALGACCPAAPVAPAGAPAAATAAAVNQLIMHACRPACPPTSIPACPRTGRTTLSLPHPCSPLLAPFHPPRSARSAASLNPCLPPPPAARRAPASCSRR